MPYLKAFSEDEYRSAKRYLSTQVASMMGRKLEEGDWSSVYCLAKGIPDGKWSNLNIDINHKGLGLELKALRISGAKSKSLKSVCGTTLMHPAATRSIRIDDTSLPADEVMIDVFKQYADLIRDRTQKVRALSPDIEPDMRTGWLIWEDTLEEFLYFEEKMHIPNPEDYIAAWNTTPAKGSRKASKSLWIYDKSTRQKRYSVTTSAGVKIQPYFDVPLPDDENLYYFRAQSEPVDAYTVRLWITSATANALRAGLGSLDKGVVSDAILKAIEEHSHNLKGPELDDGLAVPVDITKESYRKLSTVWDTVSDEHKAQLLLKALS
ncbi:hypothetical protein O3W44_07210 [Pantoea sp. LMR881]|uniref:hypothetical protein n=1 Tax=Pantoea sp. LMR881 TaxID=3014336 RepID=UPI0022B00F92|nr:hypothetical protein [Pantoea sp. LMR881]MCZ4058906.1 hypothetical protein [Pantoea sp. LMR881]